MKRKRKAHDGEHPGQTKMGKPESGSKKITGYFSKANGTTTPPNKILSTPSPKHTPTLDEEVFVSTTCIDVFHNLRLNTVSWTFCYQLSLLAKVHVKKIAI